MKRLFFSIGIVALLTSVFFLACEKSDNPNGKARLQVFLTDDPGDYQEVIIDVKDIMINVTGDTVNGWQSLTGVNAAQYDLLKLVNDDDTILADALIPSGRLHQLRLVLGDQNFVKIDGQMIPLETPSAQQSGLKLNIQHDVTEGLLYKITLDFDVAKSIVKTGNNKYILKPVIRTVLESVGGSIRGVVVPYSFQTQVFAVQGTDTVASTYTGSFGGYLIKGLANGNYNLHFNASDTTYRDSIRLNIGVATGQVTVVDTMFLQQ